MKTLTRSLFLVALGGAATLHADAPAPHLSLGDMAAKAATIRTQILEDSQKILTLKEQARKLKDVIKLNCVNDKQIQVKAEMNIADLANDQMQGASEKSDDRQVAFAQLIGAGDAIRRLREEAAACIGEPELFKQEQGSTAESPEIVDDPTASINPFGGGELEPPDSASQ